MNLLLIVNKIRVATKTQSPKGTQIVDYVVHKLSESLSHGDFVAELDFWSRL